MLTLGINGPYHRTHGSRSLPYFRFRFLGWALHCSHCRKVSHNLVVVLKVVNIGCGYGFTVFVCRPKEEQNKYMIYGTGINTDSQIGYHEYPHKSGERFSHSPRASTQIRWEIPPLTVSIHTNQVRDSPTHCEHPHKSGERFPHSLWASTQIRWEIPPLTVSIHTNQVRDSLTHHEHPHKSGEIFPYPPWAPIQTRGEIPLPTEYPHKSGERFPQPSTKTFINRVRF